MAPSPTTFTGIAARRPLLTAFALSLGAAVSLGIARFAYGLLLPSMRADLGWSYLLAGTMNTANAAGYFLGALAAPIFIRWRGAHAALFGGGLVNTALIAASGLTTATACLLALRLASGVASAFMFIAGGLLAARLGLARPRRAGLLIGLYYGGTGIGIIASSLLTPMSIAAGRAQQVAHPWQWAWLILAMAALAATLLMMPARGIDGAAQSAPHAAFRVRELGFGLAGYFMFGLGYIGYMTFIVALLQEHHMAPPTITAFYAMLGLSVLGSPRIWAPMLDRFKGGESLAILNALLAAATLLPVLTVQTSWVFVSGILFGATFLSAVASTTVMVRHNLPPAAWPAGISLFTVVFAFGQIVGPTAAGGIADHAGGLQRGLLFSAIALLGGTLLAWAQRPLSTQKE